MKTQLKKHRIEPDARKVSDALQEQLMYPNHCHPGDGRKGEGQKELKNPELPATTKESMGRNTISEPASLSTYLRGR